MDEELYQRLKSGTGKNCGFWSTSKLFTPYLFEYDLSSIIIFIFALLESKFMD